MAEFEARGWVATRVGDINIGAAYNFPLFRQVSGTYATDFYGFIELVTSPFGHGVPVDNDTYEVFIDFQDGIITDTYSVTATDLYTLVFYRSPKFAVSSLVNDGTGSGSKIYTQIDVGFKQGDAIGASDFVDVSTNTGINYYYVDADTVFDDTTQLFVTLLGVSPIGVSETNTGYVYRVFDNDLWAGAADVYIETDGPTKLDDNVKLTALDATTLEPVVDTNFYGTITEIIYKQLSKVRNSTTVIETTGLSTLPYNPDTDVIATFKTAVVTPAVINNYSDTNVYDVWKINTVTDFESAEINPYEAYSFTSAEAEVKVEPALQFHQNVVLEKSALFSVDPYFVLNGYPIDAQHLGTQIYTKGTVNQPLDLPILLPFDQIEMYSDSRWVARTGTFTDSEWASYGDTRGVLKSDAGSRPVFIDNFDLIYGQDLAATQGAFQLTDNQYFYTENYPFQAYEFTVIAAVCLRPPEAGQHYTVFSAGSTEKTYVNTDSLLSVNYYSSDLLRLQLGTHWLSTFNMSSKSNRFFKPLIITMSVSLQSRTVRWAALDTQMHYQEVTLPDEHPFDVNLFIGTDPSDTEQVTSPNMYVLETNFYYSEMLQEEIHNRMIDLNRVYGASE
ncbi:hypothetical protein UFOVP1264_83 [uncultured Caudovirales phage]|uniref:Uncharacterized protein n=1 Tax=uncultured Caudovirales phage TaxID=2100421 RepID=A0A6J5RLP5_9CAUD|nr:hypothetical protein UFOVP1264_83 [uncultured Caudovirales phage]